MGTNYYLQKKDPKTGRCKDLHIAKTSGGWSPSLVGYNKDNCSWHEHHIVSWFDWKIFLRDQTQNKEGLIFDEYEDPITYEEFVSKIQSWQAGYSCDGSTSKNHAECALRGDFGNFYDSWDSPEEIRRRKLAYWIDPEGYSFHDGEFS